MNFTFKGLSYKIRNKCLKSNEMHHTPFDLLAWWNYLLPLFWMINYYFLLLQPAGMMYSDNAIFIQFLFFKHQVIYYSTTGLRVYIQTANLYPLISLITVWYYWMWVKRPIHDKPTVYMTSVLTVRLKCFALIVLS